LITDLKFEHDLSEKFAAKLIYPEEYLNRTLSIKSITFDLQALADQLKADQDRLANELQLIRGSVELANQALTGAGFLETTYTRLLGPLNLSQVLTRINEDVVAAKEQEAQKLAREAAAEVRRLATEAVAEQNRLAAESAKAIIPAEPIKVYEPVPPVAKQHVQDFTYTPPLAKPEAVHFTPPAPVDQELFVESYHVTGTKAQLDSLEAFLEQSGFEWKIIED